MANNEKKKSTAKALGLKSSFVVNNDIYMTSFGKGNKAVLEKKITENTIENKSDTTYFDVINRDPKGFTLEGRRIADMTAFSNDPKYHVNVANGKFLEDQLGARSELENKVFGRTFDDNVHIQLIHNILDIEKIMAQYVSDIVYLLHNIIKRDMNDDIMGYISIRNSFDAFCHPERMPAGTAKDNLQKQHDIFFDEILKCGRLAYFGNAFLEVGSGGKSSDKLKKYKEIYHIIALMGSLRQSYFHGEDSDKDFQGPTWAYNLESKLTGAFSEFKDTLDKTFDERYEMISKDFGSTNMVNLQILEELLKMLYGNVSPDELAQDYYDFVQLKKHKYLGFSIKTLRETMLDNTAAICYKEDRYDSVRSKLYQLIDFLIYDRYSKRKVEDADKLVNKLRASANDKEKEQIYFDEAKLVWADLKKVLMKELQFRINGKSIKNYHDRYDEDSANRRWKVVTKQNDVNLFCKLIYMMTLLLDGKEINDLLTTLVNKFDNIASFIDVMEDMGIEHRFIGGYDMFADSKKICVDLQMINSFARMQVTMKSAKKMLYRDALVILGMDQSEEEIERFMLENDIIKDNNEDKSEKKQHDFRNFLINSVINSSRFRYMVRYSSADGLRKLKESRKLIGFVLNSLPEALIDRYYHSCGERADVKDRLVKQDKLTELLVKMNFDDFKGVNNGNKATPKEKQNKAKYQAIISLYLMVMYQIVKNMIYVNSRYVIAFHCLERDSNQLLGRFNSHDASMYNNLTQKFITDKYLNDGAQGCSKKVGNYLSHNITCCSDELRKEYRNQVDHFAVVRMIGKYAADIGKFGSWFELYHYVMQRIIFDEYQKHLDKNNKSMTYADKKYKQLIAKHHTYCKDLVKALNTPFGYNLARYKNLSIGELFDRNNYNAKTKETIEIPKTES